MALHLVLDSTPVGLLSQRPGVLAAEKCQSWLHQCLQSGMKVYLPEIVDYEVRRELLRAKKVKSVARLDRLKAGFSYLPLTTEIMLHAAELWAESRQRGIVTADDKAVDGDVILAAQALTLRLPALDVIVVTSNPSHLSHFIRADLWTNIQP